ncbi:hypothetical protein AB0I84_05885 [Streptomyces spectabilis]|uniref:hypothetical protein n=1 Tax=Streptomyces spectabilis TaxID=68270 RepID=UPI00340E8A31
MSDQSRAPGRAWGGRLLVGLETLFVLVIVAGVAWWSVAGALVLGGLLGVLACERALADARGRGGDGAGGEGL